MVDNSTSPEVSRTTEAKYPYPNHYQPHKQRNIQGRMASGSSADLLFEEAQNATDQMLLIREHLGQIYTALVRVDGTQFQGATFKGGKRPVFAETSKAIHEVRTLHVPHSRFLGLFNIS
jgi:hypothetical protein